ncbi:S1 family peptidase [Actinophytocola sp.]|uniref:S1 family peptidase n=1 Tax=Actinophytocola sp. TaxID=1872138 RepID=UPI003899C51E
MRRLLTILGALALLVGLPTVAHAAAVEPLGSGSALFNLTGPANQACTAAFAVTDGKRDYLLAGPTCSSGTLYSTTSAGGFAVVGTVVSKSVVPYNGWALVEVTNMTDWALVPYVVTGGTRIVLTGSVETPVGGKVCLAKTAGPQCGTVDATNQTATFSWGTGTGLTRTSICSGSRDLGSAFITGDQAQGIPLGGPEFCTTVGTSYFVPINPILDRFGLKLITG